MEPTKKPTIKKDRYSAVITVAAQAVHTIFEKGPQLGLTKDQIVNDLNKVFVNVSNYVDKPVSKIREDVYLAYEFYPNNVIDQIDYLLFDGQYPRNRPTTIH